MVKGNQSPSDSAIHQAKSLSGSEASEAHSDSINEVEDDLRVGQAQGKSCTSKGVALMGLKDKNEGRCLVVG